MKKLVMISHESVFAGVVRTGVAEMVDSIANAMSQNYEVSLICHDGNGILSRTVGSFKEIKSGVRMCRFSNVDYYLVDPSRWIVNCSILIQQINPDILHNFAEPEISKVTRPKPTKRILTFDHADYIRGKEEYLDDYHSITTVSEHYAQEVLLCGDVLAQTLRTSDFHGITNGILYAAFTPEKGLLLPAKYNADNQTGKLFCKDRIMKTYGIEGNPFIGIIMGRLIKDKGIEDIINSAHHIRDSGGFLIIIGKADAPYDSILKEMKRSDGVIFIDKWASQSQVIPMISGADYYIAPSQVEPCGLMPMTASRYGTIPITTLAGGLADNFNDENAIIIRDCGLTEAIDRAAELYKNKAALHAMRKRCMEQDFSWETRKAKYIELYERVVDTQ